MKKKNEKMLAPKTLAKTPKGNANTEFKSFVKVLIIKTNNEILAFYVDLMIDLIL